MVAMDLSGIAGSAKTLAVLILFLAGLMSLLAILLDRGLAKYM